MNVIKASRMGFCKGVSHSLEKVREAYSLSVSEGVPCYVYGDIVHNSYVTGALKENGIKSIINPKDVIEPGYVVIRAHGISDQMRTEFIESGFKIIDATCPVVLKNQSLVRNSEHSVVVFGYEHHAEGVSLMGSAKGEVFIVATEADLSKLESGKKYNAVLQTTFSLTLLEKLLRKAKELGLDINLLNTICNASQSRRDSVVALAENVDCILVVGDKKSANTNELHKIAKEHVGASFLVEKAEDIPLDVLKYSCVGITAGASTPSLIYREIEEFLRSR